MERKEKEEMSQAYDEGYKAGKAGLMIDDNPYIAFDQTKSAEWEAGFRDAKRNLPLQEDRTTLIWRSDGVKEWLCEIPSGQSLGKNERLFIPCWEKEGIKKK